MPSPQKLDILALVCEAASLRERLSGMLLHITTMDYALEGHLKHWQYSSANNDETGFLVRLKQDGLNIDNVRKILSKALNLSSDHLPPDWVDVLAKVDAKEQQDQYDFKPSQHHFIDPETPLPFEELLIPFVLTGRSKVSLCDGYQVLSKNAQTQFERNLLSQLTSIASPTLDLEYLIFQRQQKTSLDKLIQLLNTQEDDLYKGFIQYFNDDNMVSLFNEYPVLAKLLSNATNLWGDFVQEFLARINQDLFKISENFHGGKDPGQIASVQTGVSDNHNRGRSVIIVEFTSGLKIVYKPKDLSLEYAYAQFQGWLNMYLQIKLKPLSILVCNGYGWAEYAEHLPCENKDQANNYFFRFGVLLCTAYVLEGTDCHFENIIASGEYPQLIDAETLMHHFLQSKDDVVNPSASALAERLLWHSVLRTLLLPHWIVGKDGKIMNLSGLAGGDEILEPESKNLIANTQSKNHPFMITGEILSFYDYLDELLEGFRQTYQILMLHKNIILSQEGPLYKFSHCLARFVLRPTITYSLLMRRTLQPEFLRSGVARSIEIDALSRAYIFPEVKSTYWPILHSETEAIEMLDIPYFSAYSDDTHLMLSNAISIPDFFSSSSYSRAKENINGLSYDDLDNQIQFIKVSFYAYSANHISREKREYRKVALEVEKTHLENHQFIIEAKRIADHLSKSVLRAPDGSATWIAVQLLPRSDKYQLGPISYDLYGGRVGIALFLSAASNILNDSGYASLALSAVHSLRKEIHNDRQILARSTGVGGFTGIGSFSYALFFMGVLLSDEKLCNDAFRVATQVTNNLIDKSKNTDVIMGTAGYLLSLLSIYEYDGPMHLSDKEKEKLRELALRCGEHLVKNRTRTLSGHFGWLSNEGKVLSGFSHGAAGIAYSLLKLYKITSNEHYRDVALEGIAYEASVFDSNYANWSDLNELSENQQNNYKVQWCHGASGIGLARVSTLPILDTPMTRAEIATALNTTINHGFTALDHLCCGNLGRARIVFEIGTLLNRPELINLAKRQATTVINDAKKYADSYTLGWNIINPTQNPGFMQGLSGIGYCLLEMTNVKQLPKVLTLGM